MLKLLRILPLVLVGGLLGAALPASAAETASGNFKFRTDEGTSVVPLPDGEWRQVVKEISDEEMDMGTATESWKKVTIVMAPAGGALSGIVEISANDSVLEVKNLLPDEYCLEKQRSWEWHKQISALMTETYCWGVRSTVITDSRDDEPWQIFAKRMRDAGTPLPAEAAATQVRFYRSVRGKFLRIDYYFVAPKGGKPLAWTKARQWAKGLVARIKAGFDGN